MARAKTRQPAAAPIDAVALLKADHRAVEALFEKFEGAKAASVKAKVARAICLELSVHTVIEEEIFYPAVKGEVEEDLLNEAYVEHDGAKMLIAEILNGEPGEEFFDAKVKVLAEEISHHVKEEEQRDGMFAQARKAGVDMMALGALMQARKTELKAQYAASGIPTPMTRSMKGTRMKAGKPVEVAA